MAEVLIVVAIIIVLMGVGFVALMSHMRNMQQLKMDGHAKEIFVAAQNHLSMAKSQDYLGLNGEGDFGTVSNLAYTDDEGAAAGTDGDNGVYYLVVSSAADLNSGILTQMLPFASVDEAARSKGSYIIRYQKDPGIVLDVFYAEKGDKRYAVKEGLKSADYETLMNDPYYGDAGKEKRRNYGDDNAVIGWYGGGVEGVPAGEKLNAPGLEVINGDRLLVKVTNYNASVNKGENILNLIVECGDVPISIPLIDKDGRKIEDSRRVWSVETCTVVLDDVTTDDASGDKLHFAQLQATTPGIVIGSGNVIPGKDLKVYAVTYNNDLITNVAESSKQETNSLFASYNESSNEVEIASIRHLLNLDLSISGVNVSVKKATQISDLVWKDDDSETGDFLQNTRRAATRIAYADGSSSSAAGSYLPVTPKSEFEEYQGQSNRIIGINVTNSVTVGDKKYAGLFSSLNGGSVSDLELIDFYISADGDVGALAGSASGATITGVLVRNSKTGGVGDKTSGADIGYKIESSNAAAGGLVGSMSGATVDRCAAAVYVKGKTNVGGLIGGMSGGTVTCSYSGGHTENARYQEATATSTTATNNTIVNVISDANAGGLIGETDSTAIDHSYSTASAVGAVVGGLVGNSKGGSVNTCYAIGLVTPSTGGTASSLVGSIASTSFSGNYYLEGVSDKAVNTGYSSTSGITGVSAGSANTDFLIPEASRQSAYPYDKKLVVDYGTTVGNKAIVGYFFPTIDQLSDGKAGYTSKPGITDVHFGDWQVPQSSPLNYLLVNGNTLDLIIELKDNTSELTFAVTGETSNNTRIFNLKLAKEASAWKVTEATETAVVGDAVQPTSKNVTSFFTGGSSRFGAFQFSDTTYPAQATSLTYDSGFKGKRTYSSESFYDVKITLDDITNSTGHFAQLLADEYQFGQTAGETPASISARLIPGENITVRVASGSATWSELKEIKDINDSSMASEKQQHEEDVTKYHIPNAYHCGTSVDNSLFAAYNKNSKAADIANIRHLQNLDVSVSLVNNNQNILNQATLTKDITWDPNWNGTATTVYAYTTAANSYTACEAGKFNGIYCPNLTTFNGGNHTIFGLQLGKAVGNSGADNAGLFRLVTGTMAIRNLHLAELVESGTTVRTMECATATGYAGAVVAENWGTLTLDTVLVEGKGASVRGKTAGGLVGISQKKPTDSSASAPSLTINNSAASVLVNATDGAAGGLLGRQSSGTVRIYASYVGGHTTDGKYYVGDSSDGGTSGRWNIISLNGAAGGLIGEIASGTTTGIEKAFNAASVYSGIPSNAGGVAGVANGTFTKISNLTNASGAAISTSANVLELVYTVAPVNSVGTWAYDSDNLEVLDTTLGSGTNGAVFGNLAASTPSAPNLYYLADIYDDAKFNEAVTESTIKYFGASTSDMSVRLASYYADEDDANSSKDIIAVLSSSYAGLQRKTTAYDAALREEDEEKEYPFAIWTTFTFDNVNGLHFYGDWQPVDSKNSSMFKFYFLREAPEDAAEGAASYPLAEFGGDTSSVRLPIRLIPFSSRELAIPTVPYIPGYTYGNGTDSSANGYYVWTVYYGNLSDKTSESEMSSALVTYRKAVGGELQNVPLTYKETGESILLQNTDEINIQKILTEAQNNHESSFTLVAHYVPLPNTYTLRLMDYSTVDDLVSYKHLGNIQTMTVNPETGLTLGTAQSGEQIDIPARSSRNKDYQFLGWYTQPDVKASDGTISNSGERVFYFKNGELQLDHDQAVTGHITLYAHYGKIDWGEITLKFILVDEDDKTTELGDGYPIRFDKNQGLDLDVTLPGTVTGVKIIRKTGSNETTICDEEHSNLHTNTLEAYFKAKSGSTTQDESAHIKTGVLTAYPDEYDVYIKGTVNTVYYALVHVLSNTGNKDTLAYAAGSVTYSVEYVPMFENTSPVVDQSKYVSASLAGFGMENPTVTSAKFGSDQYNAMISTYGKDGLKSTNVEKDDVKYIFVLTYPRDQHYLIYTNTGDTDIDPELVYYGQSIQTVVDAHNADMEWYGYRFSKWVRLDGTNEVDITGDDKMQDTNVTVKAKWSGDPTEYTILVWLQNADDDEYTQQGKLTGHKAPAGETLVVTPSTNGFVITTETMTDGDQISLTSISSLSELSRYIHYGTTKMQAEKPVEVRGDGSTILNVYYDRNVYTLRFDIGFAVASDWQYLPVSATEAITSHETYYKKIGNGPNDYEPIKLEYTVNSERQSYNGYRYQVTTAGTGEQWGIIDSQAKQITSAQWTVYKWQRRTGNGPGNNWSDINTESVLYTRTGNGPGATYNDSGKTTESAFAAPQAEGTYYYLNNNQYQSAKTNGEKGKETVWTNNNQQYTGERYTRVNADSTNESYNLGFVDGKMVRLKHDSQGWYYETETYQFKNYTGDVYLLKSNTADYYVSNITSTNQGGNDDYEHFLTQKRVKVSGNDHKNPFNLKDYEGTYRTNTQYKIYYNDITARYGEHIFDEWPAVFPDVSEGNDKFYFVGWITPSEAWYWCGVATDSHELAAPKSSIKGKIDIMNWKIVDVKASNAYTSRPVTADGDVSLEFHCRYAKHGSGAPWSYVYRQFFWDPGYGTSGGYHENPDIAYVINAGNGSDPQKQADLEFYGYDRVGKDVYITTATQGTAKGYHDVQKFYNTGTNFPHANNRQSFTVDGETVSAVEIRYQFMPHQKTISFRYGGDLTRAISGVADVSKYYDQPLAGYATTPPAVDNYTFEYEWYLNEECLGDPYLKVIKDSDDQATRDAKTAYNAKRKMPDGDLTLYAKMKHDPITVIFKMTDGVLKDGTAVTGTATPPSGLATTASFSVIYGSTLHEQENLVGDPAGTLDIYDAGGTVLKAYSPTLANYTFKGWCYYDSAKKKYEKFSYVHAVKESLAPSGTLTLVPMWEVDSVGALRPVTISYILVDYDDVILNNALVPAVTAYWRDTNGNIILGYSDSEQDSATAEAAGYKRIRDGDRVTIQAREIDGKSAVEPSGTIYSVSETDHSIILRYRDTSWTYNVEYYVLYKNLEKTAGWVSAYIEGDAETTLAAATDFTAIKLDLGEIERTATSQYAFFDEMIPASAPIDLSSYCLHHYEFGKTEKDDENNDVFVLNDSSYANYIIVHPEIGNTLRVYLYPDPDAITVPDLVTYYDGNRQDTKHATLASEMSAILDCPTEATAQLTYVYYYYDKTTKAYVRATADNHVVNADTYGVRAFMTVTVKGKTYLVWQSDLGSTLANVSVTNGNKTESTPPLHLYVQRRFVLVRSWDANNWETQYATYYDGEVLRCEEIYYDTMSNLYGENPSSRLEAYYSTLDFLKDGVYAEGLGVVDGESLRGEFSAEAFRRNDGVSPNVFTCVAGANTDLSNYSIYVLYGSLTVR